MKAVVVLAALALAAPALATAEGPEPNDPIDPPLSPKPMMPQPSSSAGAKAALRLVASAPLRLQGSGFHRSELVRVTVKTANSKLVRQLRAGIRGGFVVTFAGVKVANNCTASLPEIVARGTSTGRVVVLPRDCPMQ